MSTKRNCAAMLVFTLLLSFTIAIIQRGQADDATSDPTVFDIPRIQLQFAQQRIAIQALFRQQKYAEAERHCANAIKLVPHDPASQYNLACAQARLEKNEKALASLAKAIELGFNDAKLMNKDDDLKSLRETDEFAKLIVAAEKAKPKPSPWNRKVEPEIAVDGQVFVSEKNTGWDPNNRVFISVFDLKKAGEEEIPVFNGQSEAGDLLRKWYKEGTAAGNHGDLYDNHDGDHSNMSFAKFPQLTRIEFSGEAKKHHFQTGLQNHFFYNGVVFGNSSTALTQGAYWRSQPRLAYTNPRNAAMLYTQYTKNHIYMYPEHRDHDPGHNGDGGYGDVYSANTPYVIISQGSSGSDRTFLNAVAYTLAAFHPDVKTLLVKNGALMPTLQMIFRASNKPIKSREDYLTGKAHPTVFDGKQINTLEMVKLAHAMTGDSLPPIIQLRVVEEEEPVVGKDYFEFAPRERIFDTPAAIARVMRSTKYHRRMVVSAEDSRDLNKRDLKWHWVVLRGDTNKISIKPLNGAGSVAEIVVPYHTRRPIVEGSTMESNRIDIGVFADNGQYYSAPGFVTWYSLDSEERTYNDKKLIKSIVYKSREDGGNYADPLVATAKSWRDEYQYDEKDRPIGWTRYRDKEMQQFTADGALVTKMDDDGRPLEARTVKYAPQRRDRKVPLLDQQLGDEILHYQYDSPNDRVGRIERRAKVSTD